MICLVMFVSLIFIDFSSFQKRHFNSKHRDFPMYILKRNNKMPFCKGDLRTAFYELVEPNCPQTPMFRYEKSISKSSKINKNGHYRVLIIKKEQINIKNKNNRTLQSTHHKKGTQLVTLLKKNNWRHNKKRQKNDNNCCKIPT